MVYENERLEHATIGRGTFRNFSGAKTEVNRTGRRTFTVFLPQSVADYMEGAGWYIRHKPPYREGDDPQNLFDIEVSYDTKEGKFPKPMVKLVSWDGIKTILDEETIGMLDTVDIADATIEVRPYNWNVNEKSGCKAYLQELEVTAKPPRRALNASMVNTGDEDEF